MIEWIIENWETIMAALAGLHAFAIAVVNLTKTRQNKGYRAVELMAGIVTEKAKQ